MIEPKMVFVEGGTFMMGAVGVETEEKPVHQVILSNFFIGENTVTQMEWEAVMNTNPSGVKGSDLPVTNVSQPMIQDFLVRLNRVSEKKYRLPTEAEWEFAARGGNLSKGYLYAGSDDIEEVAWYDRNSNNRPHPIGEKKPNELGLYHMCGNVNEWCQDWYTPYTDEEQINPAGPTTGKEYTVRGGSWYFNYYYCRPTVRGRRLPNFRYDDLGFRLAHDFRRLAHDFQIFKNI